MDGLTLYLLQVTSFFGVFEEYAGPDADLNAWVRTTNKWLLEGRPKLVHESHLILPPPALDPTVGCQWSDRHGIHLCGVLF